MIRTLLFSLSMAISVCSAFGQQDSLINSGKVIIRAEALYDSGQYKLALDLLKKIDPRDTNYYLSITHLILNQIELNMYPEALAQCEIGLAQASEYRPRFLRYRAMVHGFMGAYDRADQLFSEASAELPFSADITYQRGLMHYRAHHYEEAEKYLFETLRLNPFHSGSHLFLARIAILRGEKVKGMFSMGLYLAINNKVNEQLVVLEHFAKNELTDELTIPPINNPFERLDDFIRAGIAMEPSYEQIIPIDAGLVRQYQFIFEQLGSMTFTGDDRWIKFYLPVYQGLRKNNLLEPFIYHILSSSNITSVPVWTRKNSSRLDQFYKFTNDQLNSYRNVRTLDAKWGYSKPVSCWYYENGNIEGIGNKEGQDVRVGKWIYFSSNGFKLAEGNYTQGKKTGDWLYFNDKGEATSKENYDTGSIERFAPSEEFVTRYTLKGEEADGKVFKYYRCGNLAEELEFSAGKQQGLSRFYYPNGKLEKEFGVKNDSLHGPYKTWFDNGAIKIEKAYSHGLLTAGYMEYHRNGKIRISGKNEKGLAQGEWRYYDEWGRPTEKRVYKDDKKITAVTYDANGKITEESQYDSEEKMHGEIKTYHEGIQWFNSTFEHGKLKRVTYYDKTGKVINEFQEVKGELKGKSYYPTGQLYSEYTYKNGLAEGLWTYYYRSGVVMSRNPYREDKLNGEGLTYHETGALKSKLMYVDGNGHGLFQEYFIHGGKKTHGWYQDGKKQQQWLTYYSSGALEADYYYLNDVPQGYVLNYNELGTLAFRSILNSEGEEVDATQFGPQQKAWLPVSQKDKTKTVKQWLSSQGKPMIESTFVCDKPDGIARHFFADGTVQRSREYYNGMLTGKLIINDVDGTLALEGVYEENNRSGKWTWYEGNFKSSEGYYRDGEDDSTWTNYYTNGQIATIAQFRNGVREGLLQWFAPSGAHLLDKWYNNSDVVAWRTVDAAGNPGPWIPFSGTGKIKATYPGGTVALDETYKNFYADGERTINYPSGKPYSKTPFKDNMFQGVTYYYYPNGQIQKKALYQNDELQGEVEYRNADGSLSKVERYKDGSLSGTTELYVNGKKAKEVKFLYNLPIE